MVAVVLDVTHHEAGFMPLTAEEKGKCTQQSVFSTQRLAEFRTFFFFKANKKKMLKNDQVTSGF